MSERKKSVTSMLSIKNGISDENRKAVAALLNQQLADHYVLLTKTKFYHWNVEGPEFHDLHELFDAQYAMLAEHVDELAEQALKIGGQAAGTLAWFKKHARVEEDAGDTIPDTYSMIKNLLEGHEAIMTTLHADIKCCDDDHEDAVTSNLLQEISDEHHKMAWMLRMIIQPTTLEAKTAK